MSINLSALMKQRYDTAANWTAQNPTLLAGEIGIESDTKKWKVGTGATAWTSLVYAIGGTYPIVNADIAAAAAIVDTKLATISTAGKVNNSATTATNTNTASAIVARDASGNFSAGTITASLTGNASTVTTNANLTGDVTSVGNATTIAAGVIVDADVNASAAIVDTKLATIATAGKVSNSATTAASANTASAIVARDASGNFTAGTITAALTGAASANVLKAGDTMTGVLAVTAGTAALPGIAVSGDPNTGIYSPGADQVAISTNGTEKARLDTSARLLVGTSSTSSSLVTCLLQGNAAGSTSYAGLTLARGVATPSDGDYLGEIDFSDNTHTASAIIRAQRDGGTWSGSSKPTRLTFSTTADGAASPTERLRIQSDGILIKYGDTASARIQPQTDNAGFLGESTKRWEAVYAVNGTIQTSDVREKTDIVDSPLGAEFIRSLRPVAYRWKVGGYTSTYDDKGNETITPNPGVRAHYGFIAQEVKQAIGETDFGGWLQEDLSDPDSQQSLRLHEFISPIVKALQEALDEIDNLKAEVAALKAQ